MDAYTPRLLAAGMLGIIGKGDRSPGVVESLVQHGGVYFGAVGGAGALIARCITEAEVVAFPDLGAEAVHRLKVEKMPLVVLIDSKGENFYRLGRSQYAKS
jgi:fumarate hydratase subunit beta